MYLQFETKEEFIRWAQENILTTQETIGLLGGTTQALHQSVKNGKLVPIKRQEKTTLFLREDVLERKTELEILRPKYRPFEGNE